MILWLRRTLIFTRFTLTEYVRSARILVELLALVVAVWIFFWPRGTKGLAGDQFFSLGGSFMFALAAYTTFVIMGWGKRPQGYVVLARPLGRGGYLIGLYLSALTVTTSIYLLLSLAAPLLNLMKREPLTLSLVEWLMGTLPLLLDTAIVSSFVMLVAPLVLTTWPRLAVLGFLAFTVTTDLGLLGKLNLLNGALGPVQALLGLVLLPVAAGFELAMQYSYDLTALEVLLGQVVLLAVLLASALFAFKRRELILIQ